MRCFLEGSVTAHCSLIIRIRVQLYPPFPLTWHFFNKQLALVYNSFSERRQFNISHKNKRIFISDNIFCSSAIYPRSYILIQVMVQPALMLTKESSSVSHLELYARVTWILPLGRGVRMYLFPVLSAFTMTGGSSMLDWIALWAGVPPVLHHYLNFLGMTRPL